MYVKYQILLRIFNYLVAAEIDWTPALMQIL